MNQSFAGQIALHSSAAPDLNVSGLARRAHDLDLGAVELRLIAWQGHGIHLGAPDDWIKEAQKIFQSHGVSVCCLSSPLRVGADNTAAVLRCLRIAQLLGAPLLRAFLAPRPDGEDHASYVDRITRALDHLDAYCAACGVAIALENHDEWASLKTLAGHFPEALLLWDVGQSLLARETASDLAGLAPRICHIHLKDQVVNAEGRRFVPLFDGQCEILGALNLAKSSGFHSYLSLETDRSTIEHDVARLRKWLLGTDFSHA